MSKTFEFRGTKFTCKQMDELSCEGCYFINQHGYLCTELQDEGLIPDCVSENKTYIFTEVKDNE